MPDTRGNDERREKNKARVSHTAGSTYKVDSKHEVEAVGPGHGVRVREGRKATPQTGATPGRGNSLSLVGMVGGPMSNPRESRLSPLVAFKWPHVASHQQLRPIHAWANLKDGEMCVFG